MFELMTLRPPWSPEDLGPIPRTLPLRVEKGLRPTIPPTMPVDHRSLLEWSWHGDPTKRATMNDIILAIDRLSDLPIEAAPSTIRQPSINDNNNGDPVEIKRLTQLLVDEQKTTAVCEVVLVLLDAYAPFSTCVK
jgi:hypothetical protein